ncbi:dienelactone hydrolase family protein [Saccharibacillus sp. JS10]|uniref:dienelactone hydrolase family protein n=1 Tax=Saccharibacillus sp. JS10 TaxID=2950552 RepID=UPI00210ED7CB|nr:alpha/beta hydrolase family protein [Saccharibacillus sp. JS10]MCQ4085469.1 alpha/beta hydrolase family protein [Saccharibacillus sp. JS10]
MTSSYSQKLGNELDAFIQNLSHQAPRRSEWKENSTFEQWQAETTKRFREKLGAFPENPDELQPELLEQTVCEGYTRERIEITTYEYLRMPMYVLIPEHVADSTPIVFAIHGHGYGSREIVGLEPDGSVRHGDPGLHQDFALSLVRQGFIVLAPELLGFGDRRLTEDRMLAEHDPSKNSCFRLSSALLMIGQTIAGYRIYETMRAIDYVQNRWQNQAHRLGIMGISGGGLVAGFTAALDARISCAVISGYANTFQDSILARSHCLDNYIPGILLESEMPDLLGLIAPRSLLIESGDTDALFVRAGVHTALERLTVLFEAAGRVDGLQVDLFKGGHEIHGKPAFEWLRKELN